jgi:hypothetical protein
MSAQPPFEPAPPRWEDVESELLDLATLDLLVGSDPRPTLAAFIGDRPLAMVGLRPFAPGEALQALIEVLALLLPLGADRLAFAAPARAWSTEDPIPAVCDDGDLRQRVVLLVIVDGHGQPCRLTTSVHPFSVTADGPGWLAPLRPAETPESPVATAMTLLVDARDELDDMGDAHKLAVQFGRVLLLGHDVALSDTVAADLAAASAS